MNANSFVFKNNRDNFHFFPANTSYVSNSSYLPLGFPQWNDFSQRSRLASGSPNPNKPPIIPSLILLGLTYYYFKRVIK